MAGLNVKRKNIKVGEEDTEHLFDLALEKMV